MPAYQNGFLKKVFQTFKSGVKEKIISHKTNFSLFQYQSNKVRATDACLLPSNQALANVE